jgi:peroxiredoxin
VLTLLKTRDGRPAAGYSASQSVRLENVHVDLLGRVVAADGRPVAAVPLDGAPSLEVGVFVEMPRRSREFDDGWEVLEIGRTTRAWRSAGTENISGATCFKLVGTQHSDDWNSPRTEQSAWKRVDTVWFIPKTGVAARVERTVERRSATTHETTFRSTLRYELDANVQFPGQVFDDRRQEIARALSFADAAAPLLVTPLNYATELTSLLNRINHHLEHQAATPYREAVVQVKRRVEAGRRGEAAAPRPAVEAPTDVVSLGQAAPDFAAPDFNASGATAKLRTWAGRPILLVFFSPTSPTAPELLRFGKRLQTTFGDGVAVIGMAVSDDAAAVRRLRDDLDLKLPLLNGSGLRISYAVDSTPKMVLLDADGVVREFFTGWGRETPSEVTQALRRLPRRMK